MLLSAVCLSRTLGLSREQRPRKTKICTDVAHVTRDSDTTFKVKRSRSPGRFAHRRVGTSGGCSGGRENGLAVGNCCYVAVCWAAEGASAPTGDGGAETYRDGLPHTACFSIESNGDDVQILYTRRAISIGTVVSDTVNFQ